ncbi:MAG: VCBS repeat-containing protein [Chloroflexota bacterium]
MSAKVWEALLLVLVALISSAARGLTHGRATTVDDTAYGITYDGWAGVADEQASGGGYRAASQADQRITFEGEVAGVQTPNWTANSLLQKSRFGFLTNSAGDLNGDGYDEVVIGDYLHDGGERDEGKVWVYYGSAEGLAGDPWMLEADQAGAFMGNFAGSAGDVNGDGYDDFVVGADRYDYEEVNEGVAYVYYGSAAGLGDSAADWTVYGNQDGANLGHSVATAGDVNGDGYDDVIIGAFRFNHGQVDEGFAYLYYGSPAGLRPRPAWTAEGEQEGAYFAHSAVGVGDVNGDGYDDIVVGALLYDNGETDEGQVYAYYGSADGPSLTANWVVESNVVEARLGGLVAPAGDVNGDGYADVITGAEWYSNGEEKEGAAFVYYGSATGLSATPDWTVESNQLDANLGVSVDTAGDVNGDGYDDVIVGAYYYDNGEEDEGRAFVYYGSAEGLSTEADWYTESNQAHAGLGVLSNAAGDVNHDGFGDVIIGAFSYKNEVAGQGQVTVYHGSAAGLPFTTTVTVLTYQGPDQGVARLLIDDRTETNLDLYAPVSIYQFSEIHTGLPVGLHTFTVEPLGLSNPNSTGTEIRLDAFVVNGLTIEDNVVDLTYGAWQGKLVEEALGGSIHASETMSSTVSFTFEGPAVALATARGPDMGIAEVLVDGVLVTTVDLYNATLEWQYEVRLEDLGEGSHTVILRVTGTHNPASTGDTVVFDGYSVP